MPNDDRYHRRLVLWAALFEGGLAVLAWLIAWLADRPLLDELRWDAGDVGRGVIVCLPMLVAFWLCLRLPLPALRRIRRFSDEVIRPLFAPCSLAELALISALAGLGEELLFRGVLQEMLARWLGTWAGVAVASTVFGLLHAITPTYALLAALMGCYLGCAWLLSGNLLVVVVAHAVYDFVALVYLVRGPSVT